MRLGLPELLIILTILLLLFGAKRLPGLAKSLGKSTSETISFEDFILHSGEKGAKEAGKLRAEGKEYIVQDGDVFHFLFNV